jgi:hypothetical protein
MAESHVVSALVAKRSEVAGVIADLERKATDQVTGQNIGYSPQPHAGRIAASLATDYGSSYLRSCAGAEG